MGNLSWPPIVSRAAEIVASYDTGVTLRQLFYRLVADGTLPNTQSKYRKLSEQTAVARREGTFPDLLDRTSRIETVLEFDDLDAGRRWFRDMYRRRRTEGQPWTVLLAVEKAGMSAQLDDWFTDPLGIPHVALGGYASQTLCDQVARWVQRQGRPSLLVYAGDLDPTGIDIDRDFVARVGGFDKVTRVALDPDQIDGLPFNPQPEVAAKLGRDPRARRFKELVADRYFDGELRQYEVDALPPDTLRDMYRTAVGQVWDDEMYHRQLAYELGDLVELERAQLEAD